MFYVPCFMKRGFTLVEVIIAIFVLLVGILGTFAATQQIISYISFSNSKLSVVYLAQEGIEIVRNIRDTNWLEREDWDNGLWSGDWQADYNDLSLSSYSGNFLNLETAGFYGYGTGTPTKFKRKITIELVDTNGDGENDLKVTVLVEWKERGKTNKITVRENLYNWW